MIIKKQDCGKKKKSSPIIGILLFLISIVLMALTGPIGLVFGFFHQLFAKGFNGIGEFALKIAVSIDQLGNVIMQHLFNSLWITKDGYEFGNRDETISSALGKNKQLCTLTTFGKAIDKILDIIDHNHSLDSIDYFIQPEE
ncbi:hypothetical protein [Flagellimonas sp.]|uniref:hypothetical protein n=1 Tax=Flagellimonas sp. TaxID=2058762 RepID=UPI003B5B6B00